VTRRRWGRMPWDRLIRFVNVGYLILGAAALVVLIVLSAALYRAAVDQAAALDEQAQRQTMILERIDEVLAEMREDEQGRAARTEAFRRDVDQILRSLGLEVQELRDEQAAPTSAGTDVPPDHLVRPVSR
jgi:hypothetical protein